MDNPQSQDYCIAQPQLGGSIWPAREHVGKVLLNRDSLLLCSFSLLVTLNRGSIISITKRDTDVLSFLVLGILLIIFYKRYSNKYENNKIFNILSIILSTFMVVGYSYDKIGSAYYVFGNISFMIIFPRSFLEKSN